MDHQRQPPPQQQQQDPSAAATYAGPDDDVNDNFNNILLKAKQIASRLAQDRAASAYVNPLHQVDQGRPAVSSGPIFSSSEPSDAPLSRDPSLLRSGPTTSYAPGGRDAGTWQRSQSPRGRSRSPQRGPHDDKRRYDRRSPPGAYRQPNEGAPANLPYDYPGNSTYEQGSSFNPDDSNVTTMSFPVRNNIAGLIIGRGGENLKSIVKNSGARVQLQAQTDNGEDRLVTLTGVRSAIDKARVVIDQIISDAGKSNRTGDHPLHNPRDTSPANANHGPPYYPAGAPPSNLSPMGGMRPQQLPHQPPSLIPPREHGTEEYNPVAGEMIIHVPNNKVGVIIGRGGDMIRDLQERSGARIAVTPDSEADRSCEKRMVRLYGSLVHCGRAKALIDDLVVALPQSRSNPSDPGQRFEPPPARAYSAQTSLVLPTRPVAASSFTELIYIPAETAGLVIGRGGETVRCLENASGAKITMENGEVVNGKRPVKVIGTADQIAHAKDLIIRKVEEDNFRSTKPRPIPPPDHNTPLDRGYTHQSPAMPSRQEYARHDAPGSYGAVESRSHWQPTSDREQHLQQYATPYDRRSIPPPVQPPYNPVSPYRDGYAPPSHGTPGVTPRAGPPVSSSVPAYNGGGYVPQGAPIYRQQPSYGTGVVPNINAPISSGSGGAMGYGSRHAHEDPYRREDKRGDYDRDAGYSPYDGGGMHQQQHHYQQQQQQQQQQPPQHQHVTSLSSAPYGHPDPSHLLPASGVPAASSDYASYYSKWYASQNHLGSDGRNGGSAGAGGAPYGGRPGGENRGGMY